MRILLCTDGSPHGQAALRFGGLLAAASSEPATLLGVVEHEADRAAIEQALAKGSAWPAGAPVPQTTVRVGHPDEEILDEAKQGGYDLVVVGARGRRGITRFLMGSTTERIARLATAPVLIVRGEREAIRRILVCTAGRAEGLGVVAFSGRVAQLAGAQVTVLHVMSQVAATPMLPEAGVLQVMPQTPAPPEPSRFDLVDLDAPAEELMARETPEGVHFKEALDILADLKVAAKALVRHGLVVDEISAEACEGDYDLVVIGAYTRGGWMRLLLKEVGLQLLGCCRDRPVLIARA